MEDKVVKQSRYMHEEKEGKINEYILLKDYGIHHYKTQRDEFFVVYKPDEHNVRRGEQLFCKDVTSGANFKRTEYSLKDKLAIIIDDNDKISPSNVSEYLKEELIEEFKNIDKSLGLIGELEYLKDVEYDEETEDVLSLKEFLNLDNFNNICEDIEREFEDSEIE